MKKIISLLCVLFILITLSSCGDVGNPTITYIDKDGKEVSKMIHGSSNPEYVVEVLDLIDKIKPTKYSYFISSKVNANLNYSINNNSYSYFFFSGDEIIYDHDNNVYYNKINTQNNFSTNNDNETAVAITNLIQEYIYHDITYVKVEEEYYIKDGNLIEENIFYYLNFDKFFNCLNKTFVEDYKLIIYDVSKTSIIFSFDYNLFMNEEYEYPTSIHFIVDSNNGLIKSIELVSSNIANQKLNEFKNLQIEAENITYINSIATITIDYDFIPDILLNNEEMEKFK